MYELLLLSSGFRNYEQKSYLEDEPNSGSNGITEQMTDSKFYLLLTPPPKPVPGQDDTSAGPKSGSRQTIKLQTCIIIKHYLKSFII